jgi:energy-converting hydrogenase A subunit M
MKFYKQENKKYVSQTLIDKMFSNDYDLVKVDTLKNIMNKLNTSNIELLKMDIEGAENIVLNNMLDENITPKYLLVEFDLYLKGKDKNSLTDKLIKRLIECGYKILYNDNYNITFELE